MEFRVNRNHIIGGESVLYVQCTFDLGNYYYVMKY